MTRYFECNFCGQVVQGFNASQDITCCKRQDGFHWTEIEDPWEEYQREVDEAHAEAFEVGQ